MSEAEGEVRRVDILLAEQNPDDVKLALHAFRRDNLANPARVVGDGAEAPDFVFCRGRPPAGRSTSHRRYRCRT